jgi:hypothetical protein
MDGWMDGWIDGWIDDGLHSVNGKTGNKAHEQCASPNKKTIGAFVDNLCKINYHNCLAVKFCIKNWLL